MRQWILAAVPVKPEAVEGSRYFLEALQHPAALWAIRILCVLAFAAALVVYVKMKEKDGE